MAMQILLCLYLCILHGKINSIHGRLSLAFANVYSHARWESDTLSTSKEYNPAEHMVRYDFGVSDLVVEL